MLAGDPNEAATLLYEVLVGNPFEVEFVTITQFIDINAVKAFAGADYERAVIAPGADKLLAHYDERSAHYQTLLTPSDVRALAARTSGRNRVV